MSDEHNGINIADLDKAEVLAALYNRAKVQGFGFMQAQVAPTTMTSKDAQAVIEGRGDDVTKMFGKDRRNTDLYFDYLYGRVMKVDISGDEFDPRLYDRDNGEGAAESVIAKLRSQKVAA